jgi:hypothetical protein
LRFVRRFAASNTKKLVPYGYLATAAASNAVPRFTPLPKQIVANAQINIRMPPELLLTSRAGALPLQNRHRLLAMAVVSH